MKTLDQDRQAYLKNCNCLGDGVKVEMFLEVGEVVVPEYRDFAEVIAHFSGATYFDGAVTDDADDCLHLVYCVVEIVSYKVKPDQFQCSSGQCWVF